ncbi:hypothetical protein B0H14DRAFT_3760297 [Mycena olivaceomarginata]|nr:hypothetical protein B0H14DRAFT_3760297 [Mycena olivaceomarginata]
MNTDTDFLHIVPVEVWIACWALCSLQQLRRISLVCRLFRALVLPHLFREQTLDMAALGEGLDTDNWVDRARHLHRTAVRLDRLAEGFLPELVHSWNVTFSRIVWSHYHRGIENIHLFDTLSLRVVTTFFSTLKLYRNLTSLHIRLAIIDPPSRAALGSLLALKDLQLRNCDIVAADGLLALQALKIFDCSPIDSDSVRLANPDTLRTLSTGAGISPVLSGFRSATLRSLANLSLHRRVRDTAQLLRFFVQCPQLETLTIEDLRGPSPVFPPRTIPLLRNLTAPSGIVRALVPGRPVTSVAIVDSLSTDSLMPLCMDILRSAVPLQALYVSFASWAIDSDAPSSSPILDFLAAIPSLFPQLTELSLTFPPFFATRISCSLGMDYFRNTIDHRSLELNDEEAFKGTPPDDISDDESEDLPPITVKEQTRMKRLNTVKAHSALRHNVGDSVGQPHQNVLGWVVDGFLSLPPNIEILFLREQRYNLPPANQHQAMAILSRLYTRLCEVQFDAVGTSWIRTGDTWAREVSGCREVIKIITTPESGV